MTFKHTVVACLSMMVLALAGDEAEACSYSGERGYDRPSGEACRSLYTFTAWHDGDGIVFQSDGHRWRWTVLEGEPTGVCKDCHHGHATV